MRAGDAVTSATEKLDLVKRREAMAWKVRLTDTEEATNDAFTQWLARDEANRAAWRRIEAAWSNFDDLATSSPELRWASKGALSQARRRRKAGAWARMPALPAALAATLAVGIVVGAGFWGLQQPVSYHTGQGERRTVVLEDGSKVALDAATLLRVRYTGHARRLDLVRGQARFDVAHDVARPFSVHAGDQTVVATGTRFDVDLLGPRVTVTLLQGRVLVTPDARRARAMEDVESSTKGVALKVGERLVALKDAPDAAPRVAAIDTGKAIAWEGGVIVIENEPLALVAQRVSRYTAKPIVIEDQAAGLLRMSGVFTAGDRAAFIEAVTTCLPVKANNLDDGTISIHSIEKREI